MYELRKSEDHRGWWEVAHHWCDGCTIQVKYFETKQKAKEYIENHK